MFRGIFNKRAAEKQSEGALVAPSTDSAQTQAPLPAASVSVDQAMLAISRGLSALSQVPVSQAAKERGWASIQRELERHPIRATGSATVRPARPARSRSWRWAVASAAAAVAVIAALLGTYSGGLLQTVDNDDQTTTVTSVVSSDSTEPPTTVSTDGTTASTDAPDTTQNPVTTAVPPSTTLSPDSTEGMQPSTTATTPAGSSGNTGGGTNTTRPPSPTTTGEQQYAATQREGSARAAAAYLADLVITGNTSGARALVAPEGQASLAQMMMSLTEPHGYRITGVQSLSETLVRVTLEISDRVVDLNGELKEALPKFAIKVRVDDKGAVITAINAG